MRAWTSLPQIPSKGTSAAQARPWLSPIGSAIHVEHQLRRVTVREESVELRARVVPHLEQRVDAPLTQRRTCSTSRAAPPPAETQDGR